MTEVGAPGTGLMNIGEVAKPPFAVLPDPSTLFLDPRRSGLRALAPGHELEPYLRFLADLTRAQHEIAGGPAARRAAAARAHRRRRCEHGMPPISRAAVRAGRGVRSRRSTGCSPGSPARSPCRDGRAVEALARSHAADERARRWSRRCSTDAIPADDAAPSTSSSPPALQVHFARLAALLDADDLVPVARRRLPGLRRPADDQLGGRLAEGAQHALLRLLAVRDACGTYVRIKCVLCGSTEGICYQDDRGQPDTVKAETCDACRGYVKILYQDKDPALEPVADDVATLGLDLLMAEDGWRRGGLNPFLLGY